MQASFYATVGTFGVHVSTLEPDVESRDTSLEFLLSRRVSKLAMSPQSSKTDFETARAAASLVSDGLLKITITQGTRLDHLKKH